MEIRIILAHGALGPLDEALSFGVVVVFIVMMTVSWIKGRNNDISDENEEMKTNEESGIETEKSDETHLE